MSATRSELFATVICGSIDAEQGSLVVARAGHPDLLMVDAEESRYLDVPLGPAIGLFDAVEYESLTMALTPGTTFLAFTDGLVERRHEKLDVGFERLRLASRRTGTVEHVVEELVTQLAPDSTDDIAVLGLRWRGGTSTSSAATLEVPVS